MEGGKDNGFRGVYQGSGYRKFSNTETNSNEKPLAHSNNCKGSNGNEEQHPEQPPTERVSAMPLNEEPFISEKKQQENELRQMLKAHLLPGGLKSLIQNQTSLTVGGLKDEERESFRLEEGLSHHNMTPPTNLRVWLKISQNSHLSNPCCPHPCSRLIREYLPNTGAGIWGKLQLRKCIWNSDCGII